MMANVHSCLVGYAEAMAAIDDVRPDIRSSRYDVTNEVNGKTTRSCFYGHDLTMHVYFPPSTAERQRQHHKRRLEIQRQTLCRLKTISPRQYERDFEMVRDKGMTFSFVPNFSKIDKLAKNLSI
jgi:hypothetical protein